jgi:hypothetical protein
MVENDTYATLSARIPQSLRDELERLAEAHERSTSAELRVAVRSHLAEYQHDLEPEREAA